MAKVAEGVGSTYDEAVKDALSKVGLTKDEVSIVLIEEPKKRFFSILEHRQVKVRVTELESKNAVSKVHEIKEAPAEDVEVANNSILE